MIRTARRLFSLEGLKYAAIVAVVTLLGGAAAFSAVEGRSTADALWWIGAVAERFVVTSPDVEPPALGDAAGDAATVSAELRAVRERLAALEAKIEALGR